MSLSFFLTVNFYLSLISGFTNVTWRVFKLSPLYKFSSAPKDLKRYGQLLSSCVEAVRTNIFNNYLTAIKVLSYLLVLKLTLFFNSKVWFFGLEFLNRLFFVWDCVIVSKVLSDTCSTIGSSYCKPTFICRDIILQLTANKLVLDDLFLQPNPVLL